MSLENDLEKRFGKFEGFIYKERKPLNSKILNTGINNSPFVIEPKSITKVIHPAYTIWNHMLTRCYSVDYQKTRPSYTGVYCCDEWLLFTNFALWFKSNYQNGYALDKDILEKNNKIYSPKTCLFVPNYINSFLTIANKSRGEFPVGVSKVANKFSSRIRLGNTPKFLGYFLTKEEAHKAWQRAKLEQAIAFDFPPLQRVIDQLKFEIENNLETITL